MDERDRLLSIYTAIASGPNSSPDLMKKYAQILFPDMERADIIARRQSLQLLNRYLDKKFSFTGSRGSTSLEVHPL